MKNINGNKVQISLSIIVPIYNAEEYLCQCIDSILAQQFSDYELILINDGSRDTSGEICERYKQQYDNIIYIYQENAGVVSARISGINIANGYYIGFVDADDWIDKEYFQSMICVAQEYSLDVVCSKYLESYETEELEAPNQQESGYYTGERLNNLKENMMYMSPYFSFGIYPSLWSKVIKREYLLKWQLKVPHNITLGEDAAVFYSIMLNECKKVYIINENFGYHYRQTADSMVHKFNENLTENVMELMLYFEKIFKYEKMEFLKQKQLYYFMLIKWCIGNELNSENRTTQIISNIKQLRCFKPVSDALHKGDYKTVPFTSRIMLKLLKGKQYFCLICIAKFYKKFGKRKRK